MKRRYAMRGNLAIDVLNKTGGFCYYCGKDVSEKFHCDHVEPASLGGSDCIENLVPACHSCNSKKCTRSIEEFRWVLRRELLHKQRPDMPKFTPAQRDWLAANGYDVYKDAPYYSFWFEKNSDPEIAATDKVAA